MLTWWEKKTPEERRAVTQKGAETRKRNKAARDAKHEDLCVRSHLIQNEIKELEAQLEVLNVEIEAHKLATPLSVKATGKRLLYEHELVETASTYESACGVYFLICRDRVIYVGQSVNIFIRVYGHATDNYAPKQFDRFCYIPCQQAELNILESLYIHVLRPELNGNQPRSDGKHAPIPLDKLIRAFAL